MQGQQTIPSNASSASGSAGGQVVPARTALQAAALADHAIANRAISFVALAAAGGAVPDEIMLLPAGGTIPTLDGRGPYKVADLAALAAASLSDAGGKLPIDECHATDLAAPHGQPAPARGWIVALNARPDGLFAQVEWTEEGRELVGSGAYRGISPVFLHTEDNTITRLLRASLTNTPNLRGLAALHQENGMDFMAQLREALGLAEDADAAAVIAAIKKLKGGDADAAAQAVLASIAKAAGLAAESNADAIVAAVTALGTTGGDAVKALQAELATVTTRLNTLTAEQAKERATAFVDGAIRAGRVGVKPMRDHYIAQHAIDPARVEKEIGAMPVLGPSGAAVTPPAKDNDGKVALNAEQLAVAKALGVKPEDYQKTLAAEAANEEVA
ncbi:MAG: hypothetical protein GEU91_14140 [Rhizobiales bacterium]|nr:hypothetical protein [Hyphomicrobiales bacterium]